jgi:hypothetical protein
MQKRDMSAQRYYRAWLNADVVEKYLLVGLKVLARERAATQKKPVHIDPALCPRETADCLVFLCCAESELFIPTGVRERRRVLFDLRHFLLTMTDFRKNKKK